MSAFNETAMLLGLRRYPVKSMMGESLNAAECGPAGLLHDRAYALGDRATGKVASAKNPAKWPTLFSFRAALADSGAAAKPSVRITLPDGRTIRGDDPDPAEILSQALGRPVTLLASAPAGAKLEEYWPDMQELPNRDVVTDEAMPPGTFFDCATIHVLTTATLDALRMLYPAGRFEPRRFRPNLIISAPGQGFVEDTWVGKTLCIGPEVRLKITGPCPRCVMTTLAQDDLPRDPMILKMAARHHNAHVGVYAAVVSGGIIRRGDAVRVN